MPLILINEPLIRALNNQKNSSKNHFTIIKIFLCIQSTTILEFDFFIANNSLEDFSNDSLCKQNRCSSTFCFSTQILLYNILYQWWNFILFYMFVFIIQRLSIRIDIALSISIATSMHIHENQSHLTAERIILKSCFLKVSGSKDWGHWNAHGQEQYPFNPTK
jgi:ATP-dependent Zn protease